MLLELRVENYRCFAGEQALLMSASKDDELAQNVHGEDSAHGFRLLKSAVLYGPNGGGKSTLIRAAALMQHLVVDSASHYQAEDPLPIEPFRLDPELASKPSRFEITFLHEGVRYQYGFSADSARVHEEWLLAFPGGRAQTWFQRSEQGWHLGPNLKGEKQRITDLTRPNALFLSVAASLNQKQLSTVYAWFRNRLRIVADLPWPRRGVTMGEFTVRQASHDDAFKERIVELLRAVDVGIEDLTVERRTLEESDLPDDLQPAMRKQLMSSELELFRVHTLHRAQDGTPVWFDLADESAGTQALFELLGPWLDTVEAGLVVLVDGVFSNLHPMLTRHLLTWFHITPRTSNAPAQVVMTTHDTSLLDRELLRRDQIWLLEKNAAGAAQLYPLLDYKPRKDEALQRGYLLGRYGGLPFLGERDR